MHVRRSVALLCLLHKYIHSTRRSTLPLTAPCACPDACTITLVSLAFTAKRRHSTYQRFLRPYHYGTTFPTASPPSPIQILFANMCVIIFHRTNRSNFTDVCSCSCATHLVSHFSLVLFSFCCTHRCLAIYIGKRLRTASSMCVWKMRVYVVHLGLPISLWFFCYCHCSPSSCYSPSFCCSVAPPLLLTWILYLRLPNFFIVFRSCTLNFLLFKLSAYR